MDNGLSMKRKAYGIVLKTLLYTCAVITVILLVSLIGYIFYRGIGNVTWKFLTTERSALKKTNVTTSKFICQHFFKLK